jgi:glutamine amidotransferase
MGNVGSIRNMIKRVGGEAITTAEAEQIRSADKLILPGIGAFDRGMERLESTGLMPLLEERVRGEGVPVLGICLGMQMLTESSEEGERPGLGWIAGRTIRFRPEDLGDAPIPHMGWNQVQVAKDEERFEAIEGELRFYFVHSFHVVCDREEDVLTKTTYGREFVSAVARDNVVGVQFHPEKSHRFGMGFMKRFVEAV